MRWRHIAGGLTFLALATSSFAQSDIDRDLSEIDVPHLQKLYADHKYTVSQVVEWYLARIRTYNDVYRAFEEVFAAEARAAAAKADAESGPHGPLWGVPIVIKANTSIAGHVTTDGWEGFTKPGHELIAPKDATVVAKLKAAGAIILGHTNMPDFADSDTGRSSSYGRTGNAFDVRFSPGGSSSGTVTSVTGNMAMLGTGTDTANSIRMPSGTSALVGILPTRGLVSIAGIAPLDWLLDNTGPIARNVTDAAITLGVMAGPDPLDPVTAGSAKAQPGPYTQYLKADSLKGKRIGVPAFIYHGLQAPFHGVPADVSELDMIKQAASQTVPLDPRTKAAFRSALNQLKALGATIVEAEDVLGEDFSLATIRVGTYGYDREGADLFLKEFGPAQYKSADEYQRVMGRPLGAAMIGDQPGYNQMGETRILQRRIEDREAVEKDVYGPRRKVLDMYMKTMERLKLDAFVYPSAQMPPVDETMPQDDKISGGPHSATGWVNMIGVPAIVVPGGFYDSGLPFGLEFSGKPWRDGDLIGIAYGWEQGTHLRHPPIMVEKGLLPDAR